MVVTVPTYNGYHVITQRLDIKQFIELVSLDEDLKEMFKNMAESFHKHNPTALYYPPK